MEYSFLYTLPIWLVGLVYLVPLLVAVQIGYRFGLRKMDEWKNTDLDRGNIVLSSIFALLGLILAFTYASGVARFDARKQAVVGEANAIGTAFLRAELVAEPGRGELRRALLDYARTRIIPPGTRMSNEERRRAIERTLDKQAELWPVTVRIVRQVESPGAIETSLVRSVNQVLDMHTVRLGALFDKLPGAVIALQVLIAAAAMTVAGFNAGISGRMSRWRMTALALVLAGVMLVILDFDRPLNGLIQVPNTSLEAVVQQMESALQS